MTLLGCSNVAKNITNRSAGLEIGQRDIKNGIQKFLTKIQKKGVNVEAFSFGSVLDTIENISDQSIVEVNIPTGIPLAFNVNNDKITRIGYLGDQKTIEDLEKERRQLLAQTGQGREKRRSRDLND